jgi:nicotianamine synthase
MTKLRSLYNQITQLEDLSPRPATNRLFSELVTFALSQERGDLTRGEVLKLQKICSSAEYELEKFWAQKILAAKNPHAALMKFPYHKNYAKLTQLEWLSLLGCTSHRAHRVVFIGGGPLPLTAMLLAQVYGLQVTILEKEKEACLISRKLCAALGLQKSVRIVQADAQSFTGYGKFNTFFVAALAGLDSKVKRTIIAKIQKAAPAHSHVLARSSWGSREVLYRPFNLKDHRVSAIVEVRPHNDVVNSFYIFHT